MSIRIGANPIGRSNDDLQEIGGDTPLETCLAEAKEAGVVGMEKGHKRESNAGDWSFLDSILGQGKDLGVYTVPGDGAIDYAAVFDELKGYCGWVVLEAEQDPKKAPALPYGEKGVAHIRAAPKEAKLG